MADHFFPLQLLAILGVKNNENNVHENKKSLLGHVVRVPTRMRGVLEGSCQKSVDDYVCITTDWGSEVRVQGYTKGVMPLVCRVCVLRAEIPSTL